MPSSQRAENHSSATLLAEVRALAAASGFDLFGVVDAARFDACQPPDQRVARVLSQCGAVIVLGTSGARLDDHTVRLGIDHMNERLRQARVRALVASRCQQRLSFPRLADAAGFGTVSPVTGLLLHPEFGPWVRVHDALLVQGRPFGVVADASISDGFQPCCRCDGQPCMETRVDSLDDPATSCPVGAKHRSPDSPLQWPMPMPMSPVTRFAVSALRLVPNLLRFRR
ncbi:MAG: hypothetical protein NXI31_15510 [bacterium]|nr:hypothetical protein [bacterium]